jgi:hypothetical protein
LNDSYLKIQYIEDIYYDPVSAGRRRIYYAAATDSLATSEVGNLYAHNLDTGTVGVLQFQRSARSGMLFGSSWDGFVAGNFNRLFLTAWENGAVGSNQRFILEIDTETLTQVRFVGVGTANIRLVAETTRFVFFQTEQNGLFYRWYSKEDGQISSVSTPTDFRQIGAEPGAAVSATRVMFPIQRISDDRIFLAFMNEGAGSVEEPITFEHPMNSVSVGSFTPVGRGKTINGVTYLFSNAANPDGGAWITKVTFDQFGVPSGVSKKVLDLTWENPGWRDVCSYSAETNSFYWITNQTIYEWNLGTEELTENCALGVLSSAVQWADGAAYHHLPNVDGNQEFLRSVPS